METTALLTKCVVGGIFVSSFLYIDNTLSVYTQFLRFCNDSLAYATLWFWVFRFFMIHYDIKWTKQCLNNEWKSCINPNYSQTDKNWYFTHRHTFGNAKWVKYHIIFPCISLSCIGWLLIGILMVITQSLSIQSLLNYVDTVFDGIPALLLVVIYFQIPSFDDNFQILHELLLLFIAIVTYIIVEIIFWCLPNELLSKIDGFSFSIFYLIILSLQLFALLITTKWVNGKLSKYVENDEFTSSPRVSTVKVQLVHLSKKKSTQSVESDYVSLMDVNNSLSTNDHNEQDIQLLDVLRHSHGFELFMIHILKDFCLECLLSFAELIQFQQFAWFDKMSDEERSENVEIMENRLVFINYDLPSTIPKSHIVHERFKSVDDDMLQIKMIFFQLYTKYIVEDAPFEINVQFSVKKRIEELIGLQEERFYSNVNITKIELIVALQRSIDDMYQLMQSSFNRFQQSNVYAKLIKSSLLLH